METQTTSPLFAGNVQPFDGLSNERELAKLCPPEFKRGNPWSSYASRVFFGGANITNWKWKSDDKAMRNGQMGCFYSLLGTFGLPHEDKEAVAGWMLSEMLTEVPEYVPGKKN